MKRSLQKNGKAEPAAKDHRIAIREANIVAVKKEMREMSAEWVARVSLIISSLVDEVSGVAGAASDPKGLLREVLDPYQLRTLESVLESAEREIQEMRVAGKAANLNLPNLAGNARRNQQMIEMTAPRKGGA
jgi:hypothetical protein